jgi:outer membrane receptor for ferrienterochelin and colicins
VILKLHDKINGIEIVDAVIEVSAEELQNEYYTSDLQGKVVFSQTNFPCSILIQHLSYESEELLIHQDGTYEILVEPRNYKLNGVVVTGQYFAQSSKNSVYRVKSIDQEQIQTMAASDLSEVMSFSQNVKMERDQNLNGSNMSFLGLGGNNVKILLDGMPLAGRTALEFDVSQINLSNVEKIEIVEGPMSVEYGSNALAGVVNIITKKHGIQPSLKLKLQEESIGSSYGWKAGLHDFSVMHNAKLFNRIAATTTVEHRNFGGSQELSAGSRATEWDPKRQIFGDINLKTEIKNAELSLRTSYYKDWIDNLGMAEGALRNRATDDHYKARRWSQHMSFGKYYDKIGRIDAKLSFSDFKRVKNTFITDLQKGVSTLSQAEGAQDTSTFRNLSFWTHHTTRIDDKVKIKSGLDLQYDYTDGGRIIGKVSQTALDAALFTTAEFTLTKGVTVKPGMRWAYNNRFASPVVPSLHVLVSLSEDATLRGGYARGFRAPALRELYFEFVDNSHTIYGNPDLTPETSHYFDLSYVYTHRFQTGVKQKLTSRLFYTSVKDQITFAQDLNNPTITTLLNNDVYKAFGFSFNQQLFFESVEISAGAGFIGTHNDIFGFPKGNGASDIDRYLLTPEITASFKAGILNTPLQVTTQFKYNGKQPTYILVNIGTEQVPELVKSEDFYLMDLLFKYKFSDRISMGLGVKNLFDVQRIRVVDSQNFHAGGGDVPVGYGRSGFFRLNYNFNFSK